MNENIKLRDAYNHKFITSFNELMTTDRYPDGILDSSIIKVATITTYTLNHLFYVTDLILNTMKMTITVHCV